LFNQKVDSALYRLNQTTEKYINYQKNKVVLLASKLSAYDVQKTLSKGFVLVKQEDKFVTRAKNFQISQPHTLIFYDNKIQLNKIYEKKD